MSVDLNYSLSNTCNIPDENNKWEHNDYILDNAGKIYQGMISNHGWDSRMNELFNLNPIKVKENDNDYPYCEFTFDTYIVKYEDFMNTIFTQEALQQVQEDIKDKPCKYIFFQMY